MKVPWRKFKRYVHIVIVSFCGCVFVASPVWSQIKLLSRKEALIIAESTKEVELFYKMHNGRLKNCIDKEVVKPCESDWVTCIENAWVVQFTVSDICPIEHDERLGVTVLIDAVTGKVISRFPEAEYFMKNNYCLDDYDCLCESKDSRQIECRNFVYSNKSGEIENDCKACFCQKNECTFK